MADKDYTEKTGSEDNSPHPPLYGESTPSRGSIRSRIWDSFKRDPNAHVTKKGQVGADGKVFDIESAAQATADSPLAKRLKARHLQMIAIGGSIGMLGHLLESFSRIVLTHTC